MGLFGFGGGKQRAIAELGLRPATPLEKYGDHAGVIARVWGHLRDGDLAPVERIYDDAWNSQERMSDGTPLYGRLLTGIGVKRPTTLEEAEAFLEPRRRAFATSESTFAGSALVEALRVAAFVARGYDYAHKTSSNQVEGFVRYLGEAELVLEKIAHTQDFAFTSAAAGLAQLVDVPYGDADDLFARLWQLDPGNLLTIAANAHRLLARWGGPDDQAPERFARHAVDQTADEWGSGAYAAVFAELSTVGDLSPQQTGVDVALLVDSFNDLLNRTDGIAVVNQFAHTMWWVGAPEVVRHVFAQGLQGITHDSWGVATDDEAVAQAARAYRWSQP